MPVLVGKTVNLRGKMANLRGKVANLRGKIANFESLGCSAGRQLIVKDSFCISCDVLFEISV